MILAISLASLIMAAFLGMYFAWRLLPAATRSAARPSASSYAPLRRYGNLRYIGDDGVIVRRDGSLAAGFRLAGVNSFFAEEWRQKELWEKLDAFLFQIEEPSLKFQFMAEARASSGGLVEEYGQALAAGQGRAAHLARHRAAYLEQAELAGLLRCAELYCFVSWKPARYWDTSAGGWRAFLVELGREIERRGLLKLPSALARAGYHISRKYVISRSRSVHNRLAAEFKEMLDDLELKLSQICPARRLSPAETYNLLFTELNPRYKHGLPRIEMSDHLPSDADDLRGVYSTDMYEGAWYVNQDGVLKSVISMIHLPAEAAFGMVRRLLAPAGSASLRLVVGIRVPDQQAKRRKLRRHFNKAVSFGQLRQGQMDPRTDHSLIARDSQQMLVAHLEQNQKVAEVEAYIVLESYPAESLAEMPERERQLYAAVQRGLAAFASMQARGYQENTALLPTYFATIPGLMPHSSARDFDLLSRIAAAFVPIETPYRGTQRSSPFPRCAALFASAFGNLVCLNPFNGEHPNGNIAILGSMGSGKSVFIKKLIAQLMATLGARVGVVTKGDDYEYFARALGGQYFKVALDEKMALNIFDCPGGFPGAEQVQDQTALIMHMTNCSFEDETAAVTIAEAIRQTYKKKLPVLQTPLLRDVRFTLENFHGRSEQQERKARALALALDKWTLRGPYAPLFDRPTAEQFRNPADLVCYTIDGLEADPRLRAAVSFLISRSLDARFGRPDNQGRRSLYIIAYDELGFMLDDQILGPRIRSDAAEIRKKGGIAIFSAQDIESFVGTSREPRQIGLSIIQNSNFKAIFKYNGDLGFLAERLRLNRAAVEAIKSISRGTVKGSYSECFFIAEDDAEHSTLLRDGLAPLENWIYTSWAPEVNFRTEFASKRNIEDPLAAAVELAARYPGGLAGLAAPDENQSAA